jgi:hypothetical protein
MLNTATTTQFRSTVRAVCARKKILLGGSWTNITRGDESNIRTVGIVCYAASARLAEMIEAELKAKGLTAETRVTDATEIRDSYGYQRGGRYIRGTCILG